MTGSKVWTICHKHGGIQQKTKIANKGRQAFFVLAKGVVFQKIGNTRLGNSIHKAFSRYEGKTASLSFRVSRGFSVAAGLAKIDRYCFWRGRWDVRKNDHTSLSFVMLLSWSDYRAACGDGMPPSTAFVLQPSARERTGRFARHCSEIAQRQAEGFYAGTVIYRQWPYRFRLVSL